MIWLAIQLGLVSLILAVAGWFGSEDRPFVARVTLMLILLVGWPVLLPVGIWMSVREEKREHVPTITPYERAVGRTHRQGQEGPVLVEVPGFECAACKWTDLDPKDCQSCHGYGDQKGGAA